MQGGVRLVIKVNSRTEAFSLVYLPVSVIGRPFSEKTRNHFLPLLTSKEWWEETTFELLKLFSVDPDFVRLLPPSSSEIEFTICIQHPKMFGVSKIPYGTR